MYSEALWILDTNTLLYMVGEQKREILELTEALDLGKSGAIASKCNSPFSPPPQKATETERYNTFQRSDFYSKLSQHCFLVPDNQLLLGPVLPDSPSLPDRFRSFHLP